MIMTLNILVIHYNNYTLHHFGTPYVCHQPREDFTTMYVREKSTLWCDVRSEETGDTGSRKKHKKGGETSTRRQEKEDKVDVFM